MAYEEDIIEGVNVHQGDAVDLMSPEGRDYLTSVEGVIEEPVDYSDEDESSVRAEVINSLLATGDYNGDMEKLKADAESVLAFIAGEDRDEG